MRKLGLSVVEAVVVSLALYAAFTIPIGKKTPAQHVIAIFSSNAAKIAAEDVKGSVRKLWGATAHRTPKPASR